jgi:hypothetical protein
MQNLTCVVQSGRKEFAGREQSWRFEVDPVWQQARRSVGYAVALARNLDTTVDGVRCSFEYQTYTAVVSNGSRAPTLPNERDEGPMG